MDQANRRLLGVRLPHIRRIRDARDGSGHQQGDHDLTPLPWENRFRYLDQRTGNLVVEKWAPESDTFKGAWHAFLDDLKGHLDHNGWLGKTFLGINENPLEQTLAAIRVIKAHSPQWRITYAGDWHRELDGLVDDYSSVYGKEPDVTDIEARLARGATSTYYVCCTPPKPNTFVSRRSRAAGLAGYAAARGYHGFLRWAYDAWPADPVRDARHVLWPAGDTFLVYPGSHSSIRYEKLREGIVDFARRSGLYESGRLNRQMRRARSLVGELDLYLTTVAAEREFAEARMRETLAHANTDAGSQSDRLAN